MIKDMTFQYVEMEQPIFKDIDLNINENWKLGLVGRNGRGKTTFFNLLLGNLDYKGTIRSPLNFSYFPNYPSIEKKLIVLDLFHERNSFVEQWEIEVELSYLGLDSSILEKNFSALSGGEQVKVLLIELFLDEASFPLIDEPTNNLDSLGRKQVGDYLNSKKGYIVVSHDEAFLNRFVDHVLAINKRSIDLIQGDILTWKIEKERADASQQEQNVKLQSEIKRLKGVSNTVKTWADRKENSTKDAGARRIAAKQMKRSKAILKRTDSMIDEKSSLINNVEEIRKIEMNVLEPDKQVLYFRDFTILFEGRALFKPINLDMYPNDRLFIEGDNGVGKSTLVQFIVGAKQFETVGEYRINLPASYSYLQQEADAAQYVQLNEYRNKEVYWRLLNQLGVPSSKFRDATTEQWSAGQTKKALLAEELVLQRSLYVWDEVTNHLDLLIIEQLIESVNEYEPTMIAIDHNDYYKNSLATKRISLVKPI